MAKRIVSEAKSGRRGKGFRVLASWRLPKGALSGHKVDLWIPELAPRITLLSGFKRGRVGWKEFRESYAAQLRSPDKQDLLKPLALMSLRRNVDLLCGCPSGKFCPNTVLADALLECRKAGDFALSSRKAA